VCVVKERWRVELGLDMDECDMHKYPMHHSSKDHPQSMLRAYVNARMDRLLQAIIARVSAYLISVYPCYLYFYLNSFSLYDGRS
jgi:hypothetical protein